VLGGELAQRLAEPQSVDDLAVGHHAGREISAERTGDRPSFDLDRGHVAAVQVETDRALRSLVLAEAERHLPTPIDRCRAGL